MVPGKVLVFTVELVDLKLGGGAAGAAAMAVGAAAGDVTAGGSREGGAGHIGVLHGVGFIRVLLTAAAAVGLVGLKRAALGGGGGGGGSHRQHCCHTHILARVCARRTDVSAQK